jgi:hypothetical protein
MSNTLAAAAAAAATLERLTPSGETAAAGVGAARAVGAAAAAVGGAAAAVGTIYYASYRHELHKWENGGKEKEFKRQFVAHVTKKERIIFNSTSVNCSNQVEQ